MRSRVIFHPKYRTVGLGSRLVRESVRVQGCSHVEMIAVMAQYNPFAERAGMTLVQITEPHRSIVQAIENLKIMGFNPVKMTLQKYSQEFLRRLDREQLRFLRQILLAVNTVYYKRLSRVGKPYVKWTEF
ncbi:MAG: hypothetical protein JSV27_12055 [Candidatus Bathyarchaeota archaeon]|nr:MAG: hypothetical protein JSV27_12055 [Candidatus Bathyarchaeota archaeon]